MRNEKCKYRAKYEIDNIFSKWKRGSRDRGRKEGKKRERRRKKNEDVFCTCTNSTQGIQTLGPKICTNKHYVNIH